MGNNLHGLPGYSFEQHHIPKDKLKPGTLKGKKAIHLGDNHNTTIYVDKAKTKRECELIKEMYINNMRKFK